jgi:peptide/nickel transport system substrate-binding protein
MKLSRRSTLATGAAVGALALSHQAPRAQTPPRVLRIVSPWEITGLDPVRSGYVFARMQVLETLIGADDGGIPVPELAESWSLSDDRLTWRFVLRAGAKFHDGTPVDADAVVRSLERARRPPAILASAPIAAIAAESGAVTIRTQQPFLSLPAFLAHHSAVILAPGSHDDAGAVKSIIGSGPYRVTELTPPQRCDVVRFDGWWGKPPAIERASYLAVGRGETRAAMAESGQAEMVTTLAPETVDRLKRQAQLDVQVIPIPRTRVLKLDCGSPFFSDLRVRKAISAALDRTGMATALLRSPPSAANQLFPPALSGWHLPGVAAPERDIGRARALLAEAGWRPGADGILARDGRAFSVTLRTFSDRPELPVLATAMQAQLRDAGIEVKVAIVNSSEIPAGHRDGTLQMALLARNFSLVPDPLGTMLQDFGPQGGDWGAMNWSNAELIGALDALAAIADPAERTRLRRRVAEILDAELPVIPVAWYDYPVAVNRRLAGVRIDPFELSYHLAEMRWAG